MFKKILIFPTVFAFLHIVLSAHAPLTLKQASVSSAQYGPFQLVKAQVEMRWKVFQNGREFSHFEPEKSNATLEQEFLNIDKTRRRVWATSGYDLANYLIEADLIRAPGCVAFAYNNTVPYYNVSTICIGENCYLACEGPRSKDVPKFFHLLTTHHVTHLVRLTDAYEEETKKCHPYWEGLLSDFFDAGYLLNLPTQTGVYTIRAFDMAHWRDHSAVSPEELLTLVLHVRQELEATEQGLLVVHCSAGVGRTGTFLAALAIVDAINRNEPLSIEEIVYRLSLQRVHCVAKAPQYITLHRLAEHYLNQKKPNPKCSISLFTNNSSA